MPLVQKQGANARARSGDSFGDWAAITGVSFHAVDWRDYVHPNDWVAFHAESDRARASGRFSLEYHLKHRDGVYRLVQGYAQKLERTDGTFTMWGYVVTVPGDHAHVCLAAHCYCGFRIFLPFVLSILAAIGGFHDSNRNGVPDLLETSAIRRKR